MRILSLMVILMLVVFAPAASDEEHTDQGEITGHREGGVHAFKHEFALFLGNTDEEGHGNEFTWGIEYAYSLAPKLSIGGILEYAGGDQRNLVFVVPLYWKPVGGLMLIAAPGVEFHNGRESVEPHKLASGGEEGDQDETYFLFRLGVAYAFHVGPRYSIVPQINLDLVNGHEVLVGGVSFGVMF